MFRVEVKPRQVAFSERSGVSSKTGRDYTMREQFCYVDLGGDYPVEIKINLEDGQPAYTAGEYTIAPSSFKVGQYGSLMVDRIKLFPVTK